MPAKLYAPGSQVMPCFQCPDGCCCLMQTSAHRPHPTILTRWIGGLVPSLCHLVPPPSVHPHPCTSLLLAQLQPQPQSTPQRVSQPPWQPPPSPGQTPSGQQSQWTQPPSSRRLRRRLRCRSGWMKRTSARQQVSMEAQHRDAETFALVASVVHNLAT